MNVVESSAERPVLAVDLGGTQIRAALITPDRSVHARRAVPTDDEEGIESVIARIVDAAATVRDDAAGRPSGSGRRRHLVSRAARPWRGVVISPPNLAGWSEIPLGARLADGPRPAGLPGA